MSKTVFHVSRSSKTGKTVNVGDFDTLDAAREAMLSHYKVTPKRGNFYYRISEDELVEIGGVMMRRTCLVISGNGPYNKKFTAEELKQMLQETAGHMRILEIRHSGVIRCVCSRLGKQLTETVM